MPRAPAVLSTRAVRYGAALGCSLCSLRSRRVLARRGTSARCRRTASRSGTTTAALAAITDIDVSFGYTRIYGGLVEFLSVAAQQVIPADIYVVRHAVNSVFGWTGVVFAFLMARRLFGTRAAWLAAALLVCMPRYIGDSMNNTKDLPFAVLMLVAFYYILTIQPRYPYLSWGHAIKLAIAIALALNVRSMGLVLLGYAGVALALAVIASRDFSPAPARGDRGPIRGRRPGRARRWNGVLALGAAAAAGASRASVLHGVGVQLGQPVVVRGPLHPLCRTAVVLPANLARHHAAARRHSRRVRLHRALVAA